MLRNLILYLTITLCLFSCVSKKYGRHFNNSYDNSVTLERKNSRYDSSLVASIKKKPYLIISDGKEKSASQYNETTIDAKQSGNADVGTYITLMSDTAAMSSDSTDIKTEKDKQDLREQEPLGVIGLLFILLGLIGTIIFPSFLGVLSFGAIIAGGVLGIKSLKRIGENKKKWKGKALGIVVIILSGIIVTFSLVLMGLILYLVSIGQLS